MIASRRRIVRCSVVKVQQTDQVFLFSGESLEHVPTNLLAGAQTMPDPEFVYFDGCIRGDCSKLFPPIIAAQAVALSALHGVEGAGIIRARDKHAVEIEPGALFGYNSRDVAPSVRSKIVCCLNCNPACSDDASIK